MKQTFIFENFGTFRPLSEITMGGAFFNILCALDKQNSRLDVLWGETTTITESMEDAAMRGNSDFH